MKKTLIVVGALLTFAYASFVPPEGVSKMPVKKINVQLDSPYMHVDAEIAGIDDATTKN